LVVQKWRSSRSRMENCPWGECRAAGMGVDGEEDAVWVVSVEEMVGGKELDGEDVFWDVSIELMVGGPLFIGGARGVVWRNEQVCP